MVYAATCVILRTFQNIPCHVLVIFKHMEILLAAAEPGLHRWTGRIQLDPSDLWQNLGTISLRSELSVVI